MFDALLKRNRYHELLRSEIEPSMDAVLDVGCGCESPLQHLRKKPGRMIGVDGFEPSIEASRSKGLHSDYAVSDLLKIGEIFPSKSFDCVVALDVIEHFTEENGLKLLKAMESLGKKK